MARRIPLISLFAADAISVTGNVLALIAIPWFVLEQSGSAALTGIVAFFTTLATVVASFFGGMGVAIYAVGWLLLPDEEKETSILQDLINKQRSQSSSWTSAEPREVPGDYAPSRPYDQQVRSEPVDVPPARPTTGGEPKP